MKKENTDTAKERNTGENLNVASGKKKSNSFSRISLKLDSGEEEIISKIITGAKSQGVDLAVNRLFKFIIRGLDPEMMIKKIVKSKGQRDEIQKKAESEMKKVWF